MTGQEPTPEDERFVRRLAEVWRAPAPTAAERASFQARLEAKLAAPGRARRWAPLGLAAAGLAALALLWLGGGTERTTPESLRIATLAAPGEGASAPGGGTEAPAAPSATEALLALTETSSEQTDAALPPDYAAISGLFLDPRDAGT